MRNTRLPGHTLRNEGRLAGWPMSAQNGVGKTRCSCGEPSPELPSTAARKRWHAEHKQSISTADSQPPQE